MKPEWNIEHKHQRDAEWISTEILEEWVSGRGRQSVSWATLTEVLRDVELSELASDIEAVKLHTTDDLWIAASTTLNCCLWCAV